ncbi:hypothetical protein CP03DC29_1398, partial [Chlamydia psittaci 03DC29]
YLEAPRGPP